MGHQLDLLDVGPARLVLEAQDGPATAPPAGVRPCAHCGGAGRCRGLLGDLVACPACDGVERLHRILHWQVQRFTARRGGWVVLWRGDEDRATAAWCERVARWPCHAVRLVDPWGAVCDPHTLRAVVAEEPASPGGRTLVDVLGGGQ